MAQPSRTNGKGRSRPRAGNGSHEQSDGGTPARDYSIAAVGRALDLLEALSRIGPAPLAALASARPMYSDRGVSACCGRWRHVASPSRTRRAGCGGSERAGASWGGQPSNRARLPPRPCRFWPHSARPVARTPIFVSATAWRARRSRSSRPIRGFASIARSASASRCMPAPAACCWHTRRKPCRPRCWPNACHASPRPPARIPPGSPPTCSGSAPAAIC